ncbi:MAG TPA: fimbria/pilus periplasmic chaperone [Steroidobacteraceae bacterium]
MPVASDLNLTIGSQARLGLASLVSLVSVLNAATPAFAGTYSVDPVRVSLSARAPIASIMVRNTGSDPSVLQVETLSWSQSSGQVTLDLTRDVLATPPLFSIPPGGTQIIRLGLRRPADAQRELTYRVILHEVLPPAPDTKGMRVALDVSIPIFVKALAPSAPSLQWHLSRDSNQRLRLDVANGGTAHIRLETLEITEAGTARPLARQDLSAYLLANDTRSWALQLGALIPREPLVIHAKTDAGDIESRVQLENGPTPRDGIAPTPEAP